MNKMIKKLCAAAAVGLLALTMAPPSRATEAQSKFPTSQGGLAHENLTFMGLKVKAITASATATLLHSGPLFLDAICPTGGTLGKYSMAFDTGDINGASTDFAANLAWAVSPRIAVVDTSSLAGGSAGCWFPPAPIKIVNSLYGDQSDSGHSTLFYVHCSDGSNPCVP